MAGVIEPGAVAETDGLRRPAIGDRRSAQADLDLLCTRTTAISKGSSGPAREVGNQLLPPGFD